MFWVHQVRHRDQVFIRHFLVTVMAQNQNFWTSAVKPRQTKTENAWKHQPCPFPLCENTHLPDSTLKPAVCDAKVNCAATATEATEMYLQMEHVSEILTQAEEMWISNEHLLFWRGFPHSSASWSPNGQWHPKTWHEMRVSLSQPTFCEVITFPRPWHGSHSLLAMSRPSLCPHEQHLYQYRKHSRTKFTTTHMFVPPQNQTWIHRPKDKVIPCSGSLHHFYISQHLHGIASVASPKLFFFF